MLPSLDTAYASVSMGMAMTPQPHLMNKSQGDYAESMMTEKDIVTTTELHGHCERFGQKLSNR